MIQQRRKTRKIFIGKVAVGGNAPVSVQSMTGTDTNDITSTLQELRLLASAGCDIARVAVPDDKAVTSFQFIKKESPLPLIADIHFDYRLALAAINAGADGIRINPGNIGAAERVKMIGAAAAEADVPLRVGVNSGSLHPKYASQYHQDPVQAMVESALCYCDILETSGCTKIKVSLKASNVILTVAANRLFAKKTDYPLHLGVTEAGTSCSGTVKNAVAIGALLMDGIGDTIRVSLTAPPIEEIATGIKILEAVGLRRAHPNIISCPTCSRTGIPVMELTAAVEKEVNALKRQGFEITLESVAIMGCAVNGPGEAREADLGIAGGKGKGALFKKGEIIRTLKEEELLPVLLSEIRKHSRKRVTE